MTKSDVFENRKAIVVQRNNEEFGFESQSFSSVEIQTTMSVAIDGTILPEPFLEEVNDSSEVYILPKIGGG